MIAKVSILIKAAFTLKPLSQMNHAQQK